MPGRVRQTMTAKSDEVKQRFKENNLYQGFTVEKFIEKIQDQCKEVLARHDKYSVEDFHKPEIYRMLEREIMEVEVQ